MNYARNVCSILNSNAQSDLKGSLVMGLVFLKVPKVMCIHMVPYKGTLLLRDRHSTGSNKYWSRMSSQHFCFALLQFKTYGSVLILFSADALQIQDTHA